MLFATNDRKKDDNNYGQNDEPHYYGSTSDAYDIRYADDMHQTYGIKVTEDKED